MNRACMPFLNDWLLSSDRKPLVIRGARQVGKTWLVRHFAKIHDLTLIELNLEKKSQFAAFFVSNEPVQIILRLEAALGITIVPKKSILFLDEIQATPELFAKLRWFAEDMPELAVIAAGSLLEFVLAEHTFSMPVGRIRYMHLEPLSFQEFLLAQGKTQLVNFIKSYHWDTEIPVLIHDQLMNFFREYLVVGGLPEAVASWIKDRSLSEIHRIHFDLLATYKDDFSRYHGRLPIERLEEVLAAVPNYLGEKFVYSRVNPTVHTNTIKQALDLLCKAKVCTKIKACGANGIPLGAEINDKYLKVILLDVGLCSAALGLSLDDFFKDDKLDLINKGGIAEQVVGQGLRTIFPLYIEPALYYWHRAEKGSSSEIDYILQHANKVIPIEVKAGSTGSLKSLHFFMDIKKYTTAVRINADLPSRVQVSMKNHQEKIFDYTLLSLPFYLLNELHRLLKDR